MTAPRPSLLPAGVSVLERGWLSSNNVVIRGADSVAVVDTGYWTHASQTVGLVDRAAQGLPLACIVNTHLHSDHCGGNAALQQRHPQARTLIPPGLADCVRAWDPVALTYEPTGQYCPRFRIDGTLPPDASIRLGALDWEVHAAPGHDPHSVILFEPSSRTLISADALWQNGFGIVFPELEGARAFDEVAGVFDVIERLQPAVVIPGHGAVFTRVAEALENARRRLESYVARPDKHASHAAKVLLKFKLLELQQVDRTDFLDWAASTPYLEMVHGRWFAAEPMAAWIAGLLTSLEKSAALRCDGDRLINL